MIVGQIDLGEKMTSLVLHGFSASNYYNKSKIALLEANADFTEDAVFPGDIDRKSSPLQKAPYLSTPKGSICESQVIVEYVAQTYPGAKLFPEDPFEAAKVRELCTFLDVHLELVARRLYAEAFFGSKVSDGLKEVTRKELGRNIKAFFQLAKFAPYVAGEAFTAADISAYTHLPMVRAVGKKIYGEELLREFDLKSYIAMLNDRPAFAKTSADATAGMPAFTAYMQAAMQQGQAPK
jgi:glutathione S-transferase